MSALKPAIWLMDVVPHFDVDELTPASGSFTFFFSMAWPETMDLTLSDNTAATLDIRVVTPQGDFEHRETVEVRGGNAAIPLGPAPPAGVVHLMLTARDTTGHPARMGKRQAQRRSMVRGYAQSILLLRRTRAA